MRRKSCTFKMAANLTSDLSARDWDFLRRPEVLYSKLKFVLDSTVHQVSAEEVPWFVALLIGAYSPKFLVQNNSSPFMSSVMQDINNFVRKVGHALNARGAAPSSTDLTNACQSVIAAHRHFTWVVF